MSLFALVSNDAVLKVGSFAELHGLASEQAKRGGRVWLRRAVPDEKAGDTRGWAVRISAAGMSDLLHCLDEEDAQTTLRAMRAHSIRARIVRV